MRRLSDRSIRHLARAVAAPRYRRGDVTPGIVHLGVGAFHRAHQAVYVDDCLASGATGWGIVGASLRSPRTRDALAAQDGLYTVAAQEETGERLRIVGALLRLLVAPENPAALVANMADPSTRIVTLTVSEKAYLRDAQGGLDLAHPDIAHDLAHPAAPRTVHGFIVAALERRRQAGVPPFTVLCCDNLPSNGETVRRLVLQFAEARDRDLAHCIERDVAFPSTMVDRIVPATTDEDRQRISAAIGLKDAWPIKAEPFMQFVVEENFPLRRPAWEHHGVEMVADVRPYEEMKLRLLNGAHSAIAYLGLLLGLDTVAKTFADPDVRGFIERLWDEAVPTLDPEAGLDADAYQAALSKRFSSPALVHRTSQIAMDGSQKMPQRILATVKALTEQQRPAAHLTLVPAAWIACCEVRGVSLPAAHFPDPLDADLDRIFAARSPAPETVRRVFERAGFVAFLGRSAEPVIAATAGHLDQIHRSGIRAAMTTAARTEGPR